MTIKKALKEIFSTVKKRDVKFRMWKYRFKNNKLSTDLQEDILKQFGYTKIAESIWSKSKNKSK